MRSRFVYNRTVLPNGIRIVSEESSISHSLSLGIFIEVGSRDEPEQLAGIAHFLEHMAFKGTKTKTPKQITSLIESSGGSINAFTGREITGYYVSILPSELNIAIDVLTDIVNNSIFPESELLKEKEVILDELRGVLETPDDFIFEKWQEQLFPSHPLGRSILGSFETLHHITRNDLIEFVNLHYQPTKIVVAAAGKIKHSTLCEKIGKKFSGTTKTQDSFSKKPEPLLSATKQVLPFPSENAHLVFGCRSYPYRDERKIPLLLLNSILGHGMSSRLFQEIREKQGIAYSVYSFIDSYRDTGLFGIYLGTEHSKVNQAKEIATNELLKLVKDPLKPNELKKVKKQVKGNLVLALESTSSRMSRIARMELYSQEYLSIEDLKAKIDQITAEDIQMVANELWSDQKFVETLLIPAKNNVAYE